MLAVAYSNQTKNFLKKADKALARRIISRIETLGNQPIQRDAKKLQGFEGIFRVRVGDYRILYEIDYQNNLIGIVKIDKRSKVYR